MKLASLVPLLYNSNVQGSTWQGCVSNFFADLPWNPMKLAGTPESTNLTKKWLFTYEHGLEILRVLFTYFYREMPHCNASVASARRHIYCCQQVAESACDNAGSTSQPSTRKSAAYSNPLAPLLPGLTPFLK